MRVDPRVKHGADARKAAIELFERGCECKSAANMLSIPRDSPWFFRRAPCDSVGFRVVPRDSASSLACHNKESLKQLEALLS